MLFRSCLPLVFKDLRAGDPTRDFVLPAGGVLAGSVVDEEGRPVPSGVAVSARAEGADPTKTGSGMVAYTDAQGRFRIRGLADHAFTVVAGGGVDSAFAGGEPRRGVRLGAADLVLRVRRGVEMRGRLVDGQGRGFKTHYLTAHALAGPGGVSSWTRVEAEDGSFVLRGVVPGRVRLSCFRGESFVDLGEFTAPAEGLVVEVPSR